MKVLIVGFGRMGISHCFQISGSVLGKVEFTIVDPSWLARIISKILLPNSHCYNLIEKAPSNHNLGILCTPPTNRRRDIEAIRKKCEYVLVEKPVLVQLPENAMSGYVMQYAPIVDQVSDLLINNELDVVEIYVNVQSNLNFDNASGTWRTRGTGSGLTSEFLGHALTFCLTPIFKNIELDIVLLDVVKNNRNISELKLKINGIKTTCVIEGNKNVRKTRYLTEYKLNENDVLYFDTYKINFRGKTTYMPQIVPDISYFLRSYEFAAQCDRIITKSGDILSKKSINEIEKILEKIN